MGSVTNNREKELFKQSLTAYLSSLSKMVMDPEGKWNIRGFIDILKNIYSLSSDTKVISKLLEINIFPYLAAFASENNYSIELASRQNYYPDLTFISSTNPAIKFAVDIKTTYRKSQTTCNGFTLGSHGEYFINRSSRKNIQYPYSEYLGHFCLGILYDRHETGITETQVYKLVSLPTIPVVASNFTFFLAEKWKIASDSSGSGNTANIGSIKNIDDLLNERGLFAKYDEALFDMYWMNYGKLTIPDKNGKSRKILSLADFLAFKGIAE